MSSIYDNYALDTLKNTILKIIKGKGMGTVANGLIAV